MEKTITYKITNAEILELIKAKYGIAAKDKKDIYYSIKETGDHDYGNYESTLEYIEITQKEIPRISG